MLRSIARRTRPHFDTVRYLVVAELPLQYSAGAFLCAICWYYGLPVFAIIVLGCITLSETCLALIARQKGPLARLTVDQQIIIMLVLCSINVVLYSLPALVFIAFLSPALMLTGFLWLMGTQIYIANSWSRFPAFVTAMMAPALVMLVIAVLMLAATGPNASSMGNWAIAFGFVGMFVYNSINTLRQHIKGEIALISAKNSASARLAQLEETQRVDALTGLLNRTAFDAALNEMLRDRERAGGEVATLLVDLDSFKPINDTYSHEAGDAVLVAIARRIKDQIGESGIVGRMGGDEFVCARRDLQTEKDALDLADALGRRLARNIPWKGRQLRTAASVGVAITGNADGAPVATVAGLCAAADQAMFVAKNSPNREPVLYHADRFRPRMTPDDKQILVEGLANGAVRPFYQPKVHLTTGQIVGFEALARWKHPTQGERRPDDFIYQFNELGLQGDFMMSMANQVFEDVERMLSLGLDPGQVSLNISEVALATFSGRADLHRIVLAHPTAAKHITFEITEDVFIARAADAIQTSIETFRGLGVRISLDDFGTGFASFDHLRQLDFDELKIDTSFVAGLDHDATLQVLVQGFLNIASGLGVSVVAEGVETDAQQQQLTNMGCVVAQGYLFSPAIPFERAADLLAQQAA